MLCRRIEGLVRVVALALFVPALAGASPVGEVGEAAVQRPAVRQAPAIAPLSGFVENRGQWPQEVLFFARDRGIEATVCASALVLRPSYDPNSRDPWVAPLVLRFPGAARSVDGESPNATLHHFIHGSGTTSDARGFARVVCQDVIPGIDVRIRIGEEGFAYDLLVAPGADLAGFVLKVEGADEITQVSDRVLAMSTAAGRVEQQIGASWETDPKSGDRRSVTSRFRVIGSASDSMLVGFEAADRDPAASFVLDPTLVYSTFVGGASQELLYAMDVSPAGAVYLFCRSWTATPTTPGAFQSSSHGLTDAWVGKLSPDGKALEWGTYLGGVDADEIRGGNVDSDGTVVLVGHTWSSDFPTTPGSLQPSFVGALNKSDLFITRLGPRGSSVVWSTFYGGADHDSAMSSTLSPGGDVLVAAWPYALAPPATPGAFDTVFHPKDKMLLRISADGTDLLFQTYFKTSLISRIYVDNQNNIYLAGHVFVEDGPLPTTAGVMKEKPAPGDTGDAFVAKMTGSGDSLVWSTYFGGNLLNETVTGLAVDAASAVYVVGLTGSSDFPATPGAFSVTSTNGGDGYVAKLLPGGSGLVWATYLSSCCGGVSLQWNVAVDTAGNVISVGTSSEPNFPTTPNAIQPSYNLGTKPDATLTKFDGLGESLIYSTYFGGTGSESTAFVGLDHAQDPYLGLFTSSANFPTTPGAHDTSLGGLEGDMAVAKFDLDVLPWEVLGSGLPGLVDTPNLAGSGSLVPGSPVRFAVRGAAPSTAAFAIAGFTRIDASLLGGTLVPSPDIVVPMITNGSGAITLGFPWPMVQPGLPIFIQFWVADAGGVFGVSATNGLKLVSQ